MKIVERGIILVKKRLVTATVSTVLAVSVLFTACGKDKNSKKSADSGKPTESTSQSDTAQTSSQGMHFFDDAVFIGDSISLGLKNYVKSERAKGNDCLGEAQMLVAGSMGYSNTLPEIGTPNSIHPQYNGTEVRIEDGVKLMGAKKVFIMLGLNDFCIYPHDMAMDSVRECIGKITAANPGVSIYVQSVTPALKDSGKFSNENIRIFNDGLKTLCSENGWTYVDVASVMADANGCLKYEYCGDADVKGVHMTNAGCEAWVNYLYDLFC